MERLTSCTRSHSNRRATAASIAYLSAEEFMNQVITSIKEKRMDALRERYRRSCDVLLMDDVHILAGKEATQEGSFIPLMLCTPHRNKLC